MRSRGVWLGSGLTIICLAVGMFASGWPSYLTGHPWIVWLTLAFGVAVLLACFFIPHPQTKDVPSNASASVDAPINFSPSINIHNSPSFDNSAAQATTVVTEPEPQFMGSGIRLDASRPEILNVSKQITHWVPSARGARGMVVWIHNKPPGEGERSKAVLGVFASISFNENGQALAHISRACWLSHTANQIDIGIGERKGILLGTFHKELWVASENPRQENLTRASFSRSRVVYGPTDHPFIFEKGLQMEITLVSASTGVTVKRMEVEIENIGDGDMRATLSQTPG
jgi:hypothetical protein